jgi:hypothetical protein
MTHPSPSAATGGGHIELRADLLSSLTALSSPQPNSALCLSEPQKRVHGNRAQPVRELRKIRLHDVIHRWIKGQQPPVREHKILSQGSQGLLNLLPVFNNRF